MGFMAGALGCANTSAGVAAHARVEGFEDTDLQVQAGWRPHATGTGSDSGGGVHGNCASQCGTENVTTDASAACGAACVMTCETAGTPPGTGSGTTSPPGFLSRGTSTSGQRHAFVVGMSAYAHLPALPHGEHNASAVAGLLVSKGFAVTSVVDATRAQLLARFAAFVMGLADGDTVVVYFSGHAMPWGAQTFLAPCSATLTHTGECHCPCQSVTALRVGANSQPNPETGGPV